MIKTSGVSAHLPFPRGRLGVAGGGRVAARVNVEQMGDVPALNVNFRHRCEGARCVFTLAVVEIGNAQRHLRFVGFLVTPFLMAAWMTESALV